MLFFPVQDCVLGHVLDCVLDCVRGRLAAAGKTHCRALRICCCCCSSTKAVTRCSRRLDMSTISQP